LHRFVVQRAESAARTSSEVIDDWRYKANVAAAVFLGKRRPKVGLPGKTFADRNRFALMNKRLKRGP
jgi:hypothetical protein